MLTMGLRVQFIAKSGGNRYHGSFYADHGDGRWQAFNIDQAQIARVTAAGDSLSRDANRLRSYRDLNADVGGYLRRTGSGGTPRLAGKLSRHARDLPGQALPNRCLERQYQGHLSVNARHKLIGFANVTHDSEPNLHEAFNPSGGVQAATSG